MKQTTLLRIKRAVPFIAGFFAASVLCAVWIFFLMQKYSFAYPKFLYGIFVLLLIVTAAGIYKNLFSPVLSYPLPSGMQFKTSLSVHFAKWLPFSFLVLALICSLVALALPRHEGQQVLPPTKGIDIMLTIDVSGSMEAGDLTPDRLTVAKMAAEKFVRERVSDRIGVVAFAGYAALQCPLTLDYFAIYDYIKMLDFGMMGDGGTAVGDAIAVSVKHLRESTTKSKIIILVTDGESNSGTVDPLAAAKAASSYGIKVYTIGVSGDTTATISKTGYFGTRRLAVPALTEQGEKALKEISAITGGVFYRARNTAELFKIYEDINKLETTDFKETIFINYEDRYQPFLYAALIFLVLSFILDKFVFIKIP